MRNVLMLFFLFFMAEIPQISAQQSAIYTNSLSEFDNAFKLFKDKQYQSAQILFEKVKQNNNLQDVQAECAYYIGICQNIVTLVEIFPVQNNIALLQCRLDLFWNLLGNP